MPPGEGPTTSPRRPRRPIAAALGALVFCGTFLYRFIELTIHNDHFQFLAVASEILAGGVPGVDFLDAGLPLQSYLSAAGLWLFGHQVLAEVVLSIAMLSAGATAVFQLGLRISGSLVVGLLTSAFVAAMLPRLYNYPKLILPAIALMACWHYLDRPTARRLGVVALATIVGFYFRYDFGLWNGCAGMVALASAHWRQWPALTRATLLYAAIVGSACVPYLVLQVTLGHGVSSGPGTGRMARLLAGEDLVSLGLPTVAPGQRLVVTRPSGPEASVRWTPEVDVARRAELEQQYSLHPIRPTGDDQWHYVLLDHSPETLRRLISDPVVDGWTNIDEAGRVVREPPWSVLRRWLRVPVVETPFLDRENASVILYDVLFLTPLVALLVLGLGRTPGVDGAKVLVAVTLGVLFNLFLIRGNLDSHLADVIVPAAVIWAWMLRGHARALLDAPSAAGARRNAGARLLALGPAVARFGTAACAALVVGLAIDGHAGSVDTLTATELLSSPRRAAGRALATARELRRDPLEVFAPPGSGGLPGLARYLRRCTRPDQRVLVLGYQPEVYVYADRRFAGGIAFFSANMGAAPDEQAAIVQRLQRQDVPVVILPVDEVDEIESVYPIVRDYVDRRYALALESGFGEARPIRVLVDRQSVPSHVDAESGLPCFA